MCVPKKFDLVVVNYTNKLTYHRYKSKHIDLEIKFEGYQQR